MLSALLKERRVKETIEREPKKEGPVELAITFVKDLVKSDKWRESLNFEHRYIAEDVKCNLALMASVGDLCGVATPLADSLLTLIGSICGENFRTTGRTLQTLGVGDLSLEELTTLLWKGFGK